MNKKSRIYSVITGDVVKSSSFSKQRADLLSTLKSSFRSIEDYFPGLVRAPFEIHRGDSFQGVLSGPEKALHAALIIRAGLRWGLETQKRHEVLDTRIVIGIGSINFLPAGRGTEGDGEAFHLSGKVLERTKKKDWRLLIRVPVERFHAELDTECALLDALINRWSKEQAQAILLCQVRGFTQKRAAEELNITQPAVGERLQSAGGWAVEAMLKRYKNLLSELNELLGSDEERSRSKE